MRACMDLVCGAGSGKGGLQPVGSRACAKLCPCRPPLDQSPRRQGFCSCRAQGRIVWLAGKQQTPRQEKIKTAKQTGSTTPHSAGYLNTVSFRLPFRSSFTREDFASSTKSAPTGAHTQQSYPDARQLHTYTCVHTPHHLQSIHLALPDGPVCLGHGPCPGTTGGRTPAVHARTLTHHLVRSVSGHGSLLSQWTVRAAAHQASLHPRRSREQPWQRGEPVGREK